MTSQRPEVPDLAARLRNAGCVYAEEEAALLLDAADDLERLGALVAARVAGLPLEQVVGWAEFCGLRVLLDPGVFVPRRRTEFLVEQAAGLASPGAVVVDLCCGSGAVAAALRARVVGADVHAADIDPAAVACARRNLPADRVFEGDLFTALPARLRGRIDLLAVNAPYVPSGELHLMPPEARDHERPIALDGGTDGLDVHRRVAGQARRWLAPGGHLLIETSRRQADIAAGLFAAAGLHPFVARSPDFEATVVIGARPGPVAHPRPAFSS